MSHRIEDFDPYIFSSADRRGMTYCEDISQKPAAEAQLEACRERLKTLARKRVFTAQDIATMLHAAGTSLDKSVGELEARWDQLVDMVNDGRFDSKQIANIFHDTSPTGLGDAIDAVLEHKETLNRYVDNRILLPDGVVGVLHDSHDTLRQSLDAMEESELALKRLTKGFGVDGHRFGPKALGHSMHHAGRYLPQKAMVMEERWAAILPLVTSDHISWNLAAHLHEKDPDATRETLDNIIAEPDRISKPGMDASRGFSAPTGRGGFRR